MATISARAGTAARYPSADRLRPALWLSSALAAAALAGCGLTLAFPGVLRGPAAMNGSARGTAIVVLIVALPALLASMYWAARGSVRAIVVWLGVLAPVLYDGVLFMFATPFNRLFLVYAAMLSLAIWSVIALLATLDLAAVRDAVAPGFPRRALAAGVWAIAALNLLAWMSGIVPALLSSGSPAFLAGTGLPTSPVYVQDLTFWIPLMVVTGAWLWRRSPWGYLLAGAAFVFGAIESVSIAVDQWVGSAADPASPAVSAAIVPGFAVLAALLLVPIFFYFQSFRGPS